VSQKGEITVGFLKKLFGGGGAASSSGGDRDGLYYYVQSNRSGEVVQVRLHRYNDLSDNEQGDGFYARKIVVGESSFDRIEVEFFFDKRRQLSSADINGGKLVDRAAYQAFLAQHQRPTSSKS
jgi:hypothetical protein